VSSREDDFKARMIDDITGSPVIVTGTPLMATLTGGVFTKAAVGREGITRNSASGAFDANGYLKPCALVKQRGLVPDGGIRDGLAQDISAAQMVEIYVYEDNGYTNIDAALVRIRDLFIGYHFTSSFEVEWVNLIDRERDEGALQGASMARIDFRVRSIE
jgi:hypothetical protein